MVATATMELLVFLNAFTVWKMMDYLALQDSNGKFVVWTQNLSAPLIVAQPLAENAIRTEPFKITSIEDASTVQRRKKRVLLLAATGKVTLMPLELLLFWNVNSNVVIPMKSTAATAMWRHQFSNQLRSLCLPQQLPVLRSVMFALKKTKPVVLKISKLKFAELIHIRLEQHTVDPQLGDIDRVTAIWYMASTEDA